MLENIIYACDIYFSDINKISAAVNESKKKRKEERKEKGRTGERQEREKERLRIVEKWACSGNRRSRYPMVLLRAVSACREILKLMYS